MAKWEIVNSDQCKSLRYWHPRACVKGTILVLSGVWWYVEKEWDETTG